MFKSWRLGTILGFPVELSASFLVLLGLVLLAYGGLAGVALVLLAFASVLVHELGHAVVARHLGVHIAGIELSFFGGAAKMMETPRKPSHELAIAAAGPIVSLALAGLGLGLGGLLHAPLLAWLGWTNLVIAIFNLIPALPMDGGRILRAALSTRLGYVRATDIAVDIARVVAVGFVIVGLAGAYQLLLLAPFLWMMGTQERMLARMVTAPHAGGHYGAGGHGDGWRAGPAMRRFTIVHRGGRVVIEEI